MSCGGRGQRADARRHADRGYVEGVAESAFGNVTSQSFGAEVGVTVRPDLQVFGSFGHVRDVATTEIEHRGADRSPARWRSCSPAPSATR